MTALLNVSNSVLGRKWVARCGADDKIAALLADGHSQITASLLAGRDIDAAHAPGFLNPSLRTQLPDPSTMADMDKAACAILDAIDAGRSITVFADYDVDGGTSAAQLIRWSRSLGAEFNLYVPDRIREGYGPSIAAMKALKSGGAELVITVDCGAAAHDALRAAKEIDLPIVVIDHHLMHGEAPPALALVNPNRADDSSGLGHMAAAGVTFMLLVALNREARRRGREDLPDLRLFLDLAALGTVCDVVPLIGVNRLLVTQGLKVLSARTNPGIDALARAAGLADASEPMDSYTCGFILGPRINAGGRIGQADMGAKLLSSENLLQIEQYAADLDHINAQRKILQDRILREALESADKLPKGHAVTLVAMENWHAGVIGIVAGRLKDQYERPAIVIGIDEDENGTLIGKGSGRSIKGVNLGAAISKAKDEGILIAGGGHEMAAGLSIKPDKIAEFQSFIENILSASVTQARANPVYKIDALLSAGGANLELIEEIQSAGPYGSGNPQPVFAFPNMRISYAQALKGGHVRCAFEDRAGARLSGIAFRAEDTGLADVLLQPNPPSVHVAGRLKKDVWNGRTKIDLQVSDLAIAAP